MGPGNERSSRRTVVAESETAELIRFFASEPDRLALPHKLFVSFLIHRLEEKCQNDDQQDQTANPDRDVHDVPPFPQPPRFICYSNASWIASLVFFPASFALPTACFPFPLT